MSDFTGSMPKRVRSRRKAPRLTLLANPTLANAPIGVDLDDLAQGRRGTARPSIIYSWLLLGDIRNRNTEGQTRRPDAYILLQEFRMSLVFCSCVAYTDVKSDEENV